jgi:hypothetical protein
MASEAKGRWIDSSQPRQFFRALAGLFFPFFATCLLAGTRRVPQPWHAPTHAQGFAVARISRKRKGSDVWSVSTSISTASAPRSPGTTTRSS